MEKHFFLLSVCAVSVPGSVWLAWGGGGGVLFPPTWLRAACSPWGGCGCGDLSLTLQRALLRAGFARCGGGMRVPGGAPLAWLWGVRGRALSHPRPLVLAGVRPGSTTHWLWVQGVRAWGPVTSPTARTLACWLCALWGRHEVPGGGASCLGVGCPWSGALPPPTTRPFGCAAGAHYPLTVGAGGAAVGTRQQRHSACSCELALRAVGAA